MISDVGDAECASYYIRTTRLSGVVRNIESFQLSEGIIAIYDTMRYAVNIAIFDTMYRAITTYKYEF